MLKHVNPTQAHTPKKLLDRIIDCVMVAANDTSLKNMNIARSYRYFKRMPCN